MSTCAETWSVALRHHVRGLYTPEHLFEAFASTAPSAGVAATLAAMPPRLRPAYEDWLVALHPAWSNQRGFTFLRQAHFDAVAAWQRGGRPAEYSDADLAQVSINDLEAMAQRLAEAPLLADEDALAERHALRERVLDRMAEWLVEEATREESSG